MPDSPAQEITTLEYIVNLDQHFFFFINQNLRNQFFDFVMPYLRDKNFWIPLYAVLVAYFIWKFRKQSWIALVMATVTVVATDQIASSIIKPLVHRHRPCNDPLLANYVHMLVDCGSGFSFVSSHAANHFGIACFLIVLLKNKFRWIVPAALMWALLISFAQVYVGLHFPLDVICGGILGICIGTATGRICKSILAKKNPEHFHK